MVPRREEPQTRGARILEAAVVLCPLIGVGVGLAVVLHWGVGLAGACALAWFEITRPRTPRRGGTP